MKTKQRVNYRVEVCPRSPGEFGVGYISGIGWIEAEEQRACKKIAEQVKRHVDGLAGVNVVWDTEETCEHCGATWTEGDSKHNGGCCDKDYEVYEGLIVPTGGER